MRRGWIAALTISALLLAGCGSSGAEEQFDRFRQSLETSGSVTVTAEVTAVSDEDVLSYTLSCAEVEDGYDIAVTGPELLSGVRAHLRQNDATLEFDNIVIPMGSLNDNGLSPLTLDAAMSRAAQTRANELRQSFSHTRPNGTRGFDASTPAMAMRRFSPPEKPSGELSRTAS